MAPAFIAAWAGSLYTGSSLYVASAIYAAAYVAAVAAYSYALSAASNALVGRPRQAGGGSREIVIKTTVAPRGIVYGEVTCGGVLVFMGTTGSQNEYLDFVIAIAGHQIYSITDVWFDDTKIVNADIGSGAAGGGAVGGSGDYRVRDGVTVAYVYKYLGTSAQTASPQLTAPIFTGYTEWTANHRLRGCAYVHIRLRRNSKAYETGPPQNFRFHVKGALVYDPRKDTTNGGTGAHRLDDATTWEWSNNSALCIADYVAGGTIVNDLATPTRRRGFGALTSDINWPAVIAAANICDEDVSIPGSTTQNRYELDGAVYPSDDSSDADCLDQLLTSMIGQLVFMGGTYYLYAGAYQSPTYTLTEADLAGPISYRTAAGRADRYNVVRGTRYDSDQGSQVEFFGRTDSAYQATDGRALFHDIELPCTTNEYRAQRIATVILKRSREMQTLIWPGQMSSGKIAVWETVRITVAELGLSAKIFRCIERRSRPGSDGSDPLIELTLREENSSTYTDPATGDYTTPGSVSGSTPAGRTPDAPSGFTAAQIVNGINFSWTLPADVVAGDVTELWEYGSSTPFASATKIWEGAVSSVFIPKSDTTTRYYWIRTRATGGGVSATDPESTGLSGKASSVSTALSAAASPGTISATGSGTSVTTGSVTASGSAGTSPYTYAWTKLSGGTISANSTTSATTTFTATSLASAESRTAIFRCTVTDNVSATATADVTVTIARDAMSVSISPASLYKSGTGFNQTTASCTATPTGGVSTYSYAWTQISGDTFTINSASSATTTFTTSGMSSGDTRAATFRCTVTDSTGGTPLTAHADIDVTVDNTNPA